MPINNHPVKYRTAILEGESRLNREDLCSKIEDELRGDRKNMTNPTLMPGADNTLQMEVYDGVKWMGCIDMTERTFGNELPNYYSLKIWSRKDAIVNYLKERLENISDLIIYHPETENQRATNSQKQPRSFI